MKVKVQSELTTLVFVITLIYYIVQIMTYSYKDVQGKQKASEIEPGGNLI